MTLYTGGLSEELVVDPLPAADGLPTIDGRLDVLWLIEDARLLTFDPLPATASAAARARFSRWFRNSSGFSPPAEEVLPSRCSTSLPMSSTQDFLREGLPAGDGCLQPSPGEGASVR